MSSEDFKSAKHAGVYSGIVVIVALILSTGICTGDVANSLMYICPAGFFLAYGVCYNYLENKKIEDDSKLYKRFKTTLLPFFVVSICICAYEAYVVLGSDQKDVFLLMNGVSDTMSLYGYGAVGMLSALFIAGYGYEILRSKFKIPASAVIIAVLFGLFSYLYTFKFDPSFIDTSVKYYFYRLIMAVAYRGLLGMIFVCAGEALEVILVCADKNSKPLNRLFIAIIGVLIVICGVIVAIMNEDVSMTDMVIGNPILYVIGSLLISVGAFLVCRWIGEGWGLEYLGNRFVYIYSIGCCLGGGYLSRQVSQRLFILTNHNFVKNFSAIATMVVVEIVALLVYHYYMRVRRQ